MVLGDGCYSSCKDKEAGRIPYHAVPYHTISYVYGQRSKVLHTAEPFVLFSMAALQVVLVLEAPLCNRLCDHWCTGAHRARFEGLF